MYGIPTSSAGIIKKNTLSVLETILTSIATYISVETFAIAIIQMLSLHKKYMHTEIINRKNEATQSHSVYIQQCKNSGNASYLKADRTLELKRLY